jgi:ferredoxin
MSVIVDENICIGCGLCADTCPEIFKMDGDTAKVIVVEIPDTSLDLCRQAADKCPVNAISIK